VAASWGGPGRGLSSVKEKSPPVGNFTLPRKHAIAYIVARVSDHARWRFTSVKMIKISLLHDKDWIKKGDVAKDFQSIERLAEN
jgi:hypothetical protein